MNGILNLLKPPGLTSNDAIKRVKSMVGKQKIGHTGTLDPGAAGVLPLCLGKATKVASLFLMDKKEYWCEVKLGEIRDTDDAQGHVEQVRTVDVSAEDIEDALMEFQGPIQQRPPRYSAVKVKGQRAYALSRRGEDFTLNKRLIHIYSITIHEINPPYLRFSLICSRGTYIRSLARDLGEKLGVGGYVNFLLRVRAGPFALVDSNTFEELEEDGVQSHLLSVDAPLSHLPEIVLSPAQCAMIKTGQGIRIQEQPLASEEEIYIRMYDEDNTFLALGQQKGSILWPRKVFI